MGNMPSWSAVRPDEPTSASSADVLPLSEHVPTRAWHTLVRPKFVENAVLVADLLFIIAASIACSSAYSWLITGVNVTAFAGLGTIVAINFTAMMTARQNYQLKSLALFPKQARDASIIWTGVYGILAFVGFTMKISNEFSRGSVILFFV